VLFRSRSENERLVRVVSQADAADKAAMI
jgi:hypothetical protein